jgi:hypothetical protein
MRDTIKSWLKGLCQGSEGTLFEESFQKGFFLILINLK